MIHSDSIQQREQEEKENDSFDTEFPDVSDYFTIPSGPFQQIAEPDAHRPASKRASKYKTPLAPSLSLVNEPVSLVSNTKQVFDLTCSDDEDKSIGDGDSKSHRNTLPLATGIGSISTQPHVIDLLNAPDESPTQERKSRSGPYWTRSLTRASRHETSNHPTRTFLRTMLASLPSLFETSPLAAAQSTFPDGIEPDTEDLGDGDVVMMASSSSSSALVHDPPSTIVPTTPTNVLDLTTTPVQSTKALSIEPLPLSSSSHLPFSSSSSSLSPPTSSSSSSSSSSSAASIQCRICLDRITQPAATDCGHVFCHACLAHAVTSQGKCPLCRKSLSLKKIRRLYL